MVMVPPSLPSKIHPGYLPSSVIYLHPLSLSPDCLLSDHFCLVDRPPPAARGHPSSVRQTSDKHPANALLLVPCTVSQRMKAFPPDLCGWWYLVWVWAKGRRRRRPLNCLELLDASIGVAILRRRRRIAARGPSSDCGACLCTPPPFPVQPYVSQYPPS